MEFGLDVPCSFQSLRIRQNQSFARIPRVFAHYIVDLMIRIRVSRLVDLHPDRLWIGVERKPLNRLRIGDLLVVEPAYQRVDTDSVDSSSLVEFDLEGLVRVIGCPGELTGAIDRLDPFAGCRWAVHQ